MRWKITVVTAGHLSTCPRMLKAADAFADAGNEVRVVSARFIDWATEADDLVRRRRRRWQANVVVDYSRSTASAAAVGTALRQRVARASIGALGASRAPWWAVTHAYSRAHSELVREAARAPADLVYGGTSGALAATAEAALRLNVPYALDLEDLHTAERTGAEAATQHALAARVEDKTIRDAAFVTTSSAPIADAYHERLGRRPTVLHNVFPLPPAVPTLSTTKGALRFYWFGQTIGPGRALEDAIDALALAGINAKVDLRGRAVDAYVDALRARAAAAERKITIEVLPPVDPDTLLETCREYDVGISTEDPVVENRRRCLSNKFCTYLLGGLAVAATDTPGQRTVAGDVGPGAAWYSRGTLAPLAEAFRRWDADREALATARRASWNAARTRWNWEHPDERGALLGLVGAALA